MSANEAACPDPYEGWAVVPSSGASSGVTVKPLGAVRGGIVILFDAAGLRAAGLSLGQRLDVRVRPDGKAIALISWPSFLKLSKPLDGEVRAGHVARLVIPGPRADFTEPCTLAVEPAEGGAVLLTLPAGKVVRV